MLVIWLRKSPPEAREFLRVVRFLVHLAVCERVEPGGGRELPGLRQDADAEDGAVGKNGGVRKPGKIRFQVKGGGKELHPFC